VSNRVSRRKELHAINEINVMPLVDLLLQLFIAVIIFFPLVEYGLHIEAPRVTLDPIEQKNIRTISLDRQGRLALNDRPLASMNDLRVELSKLAAARPKPTVLVKADKDNAYDQVMKVVGTAHTLGLDVGLITQEEERRR
jgi:biopolymer transport protein ExbD